MSEIQAEVEEPAEKAAQNEARVQGQAENHHSGPPTPEVADRLRTGNCGVRPSSEQRAASAMSAVVGGVQLVRTADGSSSPAVAVMEDTGDRYEGQIGDATIEGHGLLLFSGGGSYAGQVGPPYCCG